MATPSRLKEGFESVSPLKIEAGPTSIKVGLSRRFLLFQILRWFKRKVEDEPHLNFLSILKSYKALTEVLDGTLHELYRDRNALYFKKFFIDASVYALVKADLEWVHARAKERKEEIHITITKRGVIVYDNYQENSFNVFLLTIHSGTWMRKDIEKKQTLTPEQRLLEEDIHTQTIYADLVLKKSGIWIDNKASRFACDYNRARARAIYKNHSEEWVKILWKHPLTKEQQEWLLDGYDQFYHTLASIIKTHQFNIIFDGHSMKDLPGRPDISFGTKYIPGFYLPIVHSMLASLRKNGHKNVAADKPFVGGNILRWMNHQFPDRFVCSMEVNKKLYMTKDRTKVIPSKCEKLARDIARIFNIDT